MLSQPITREAAARELLRRRRARTSLTDFSQSITIPGAPVRGEEEKEGDWLFQPIETQVAHHHRLIMQATQRCMETAGGRLMIFAPPGSAKSSYVAVVAPAWALGRWTGHKCILTSYAATPAERQSRRCRAIVGSAEYRGIFPDAMLTTSNVKEWELSNDSSLLAAGILGAITSARADTLIIDDPVAGREEADSEVVRKKTLEAYNDDLMTRLKPGASVIIIQTRWHMDDLAGSILPEDYDGRSGPVLCRDGQTWEVLNITAKCERTDDPLGRAIGEYLWPQWFTAAHWANFEHPSKARTWASLYQQRPTPDSGGQFEKGWFHWYDPGEQPRRLRMYGASDYAVTELTLNTNPDFTEHGAWGVDESGDLWMVDWWFGQEAPDVTIGAWLDLVHQHKPVYWFDEAGVIRNATEPLKKRMQLERAEAGKPAWTTTDYIASTKDKIARVASFRGLASAGKVHIPRTPEGQRLVAQLCAFPFARYDDAVDVCGNLGRGLERVWSMEKEAERGKPKTPDDVKPGSPAPMTEAYLRQLENMDDEDRQRASDYYS